MAKVHEAPSRIALVGMMGCGKTTVGKLLADQLEEPFIDLDDLIEQRTSKTINEFFSQNGEFDFRACEAQMLRDVPRRFPNAVLATGGGTPLQFENMTFLNKNFLTIFLDIDAQHLVDRLANQRDQRPLLHRDDWETFLTGLVAQRRPAYEQADVTVKVTGGESELAAKQIIAALPQLTGH